MDKTVLKFNFRLKRFKEFEYILVKPSYGLNEHLKLFVEESSCVVQDLKFFQSTKTKRGPLPEGWRESFQPIMCSYKVVEASFEVWGVQTKMEDLIQKVRTSTSMHILTIIQTEYLHKFTNFLPQSVLF